MAKKDTMKADAMLLLQHGNVPVCWNMDDLSKLRWETAHHRDDIINRQYESAGHNYGSMTIDICQQDQVLPEWCNSIAAGMGLAKPAVALHRMKPGHYLPIHSDLYGAYRRINNVGTQSITRVIVFLEDHRPGHMLDINGLVVDDWSAGDWVSWQDDTLHAAYNMGLEDRYTLQITGYKESI